MDSIPLPDGLKSVSRPLLEDYVSARIRQFSSAFVQNVRLLGPEAASLPLELAFNQTLCLFGSSQQQHEQQEADSLYLRFTHRCKFLGCKNKECLLCVNNPNKKCSEHDNFDECYADNQVLKSKCDADVYIELVSRTTGRPVSSMSGTETQICVIDGDSIGPGGRTDNVKELCKSDEGGMLLGAHVACTKGDGLGRLLLRLQDGICRLPDLYITDKNDTFHMEAHTYSSFRLMARAIQRDLMGKIMVLDHIAPAVSETFIVKTQRALNDYRKSEYPHYKDELTKLRFIGSITAQRLRDIQSHIPNVPFTVVETVEQLKHLLLFADQNRQVETKLLEILNSKGKLKHKWEYLRETLLEKIVYDDMVHRAWFIDETMTQGLLFTCKQGQVNMDKPFGLVQRVSQGSQSRLQALCPSDPQSQELMKAWRSAAEESWSLPGHPGWAVVSEQLDLVTLQGGVLTSPSGPVTMSTGRRTSVTDAMETSQGMPKRESAVSAGPTGFPYFGPGGSSAPIDSTPAAFQFTALRGTQVPNTTLTTGLGGSAARADGKTGLGMQDTSAQLNPFAQVARRPQAALDPSPDRYRPSAGHASTGGAGTHPLLRHAADYLNAQHQTTSPHPFALAVASHDFLSMEAMRANSSPAMQSRVFTEGMRMATAPDPIMEPAVEPGPSGGSDRPSSRAGRQQLSRYRRMSAADVEVMGQSLLSPPVYQSLEEPPVDVVSLSKRPRASLPLEPVYPDADSSLAYQDAGMGAAPQEAIFEELARAHSNADAFYYHQESLGRHYPRSRLDQGERSFQADPSFRAQSPPLPLATSHAPHSAEANVLPPLPPGDPSGMAVRGPSSGGMTSNRGPSPVSPSHRLSTSMQQTLHIAEGTSQLGDAIAAPDSMHVSSPGQHLAEASHAPPPPLKACESESFNRVLNRFLGHSESDLFKGMVEGDLNSPTGNDPQGHGQDFGAFFDSFTAPEPPPG